MKKYLYFSIVFFVFIRIISIASAQKFDSVEVGSPIISEVGVPPKSFNLSVLSKKFTAVSADWEKLNKNYTTHPDAGYIPPDIPEGNIIEIFSKRTQSTRQFIDANDPSLVHSQGALGALHYRKNNQWLAIDHRLEYLSDGKYEASRQPLPVGFDTHKAESYILTAAGKIKFNRWTLFGLKNGMPKVVVADADWSNVTAGDDGLRITEIFPGIDAEMIVGRGSIKTSFIVKKWIDNDFEELILSDQFEDGVVPLTFWYDNKPIKDGKIAGELSMKKGKSTLLNIGKAFMYASQDPTNVADLVYVVNKQELGISIRSADIKELLKKGPVIIDPLINGGSGSLDGPYPLNSYRNPDNNNCDNYTFNESCSYSWTVPVPAGIQVITTTHTNNLEVVAPCTRDKMGFRVVIGDDGQCGKDILWVSEGRPATPGVIGGRPNVIENYNDCLPVKCEDYNLKVSIAIIRACMGPNECESSCVSGTGPFITTVTGRTLEMISLNSSHDLTMEICPGESVLLTPVGDYGVKPYTYVWSDGVRGAERTVRPSKDVAYSVDIRDACQSKVSESVSIRVKQQSTPPELTIASNQNGTVCAGTPIMWQSEVSQAGDYTYQWMRNGNEVAGANESSWVTTELTSNDKVSLVATVSETCFEPYKINSNELNATIYDQPVRDEVIELNGCDSLIYSGQVFYESTEIDTLIQSTFGCDSIRQITKINIEKFAVQFNSLTSLSVNEKDQINLIVESNLPEFSITRWEPAFLFQSMPQEKRQQLNAVQTETFIVYAISPNQCIDSDTLKITVNSASNLLLMPTAFTPNGDQVNDVWSPLRLNDFPEGELFVYNRWGQCVFHTKDYSQPWDGTFNGAPVMPGVYSYRLLIPARKELHGFVTVIH